MIGTILSLAANGASSARNAIVSLSMVGASCCLLVEAFEGSLQMLRSFVEFSLPALQVGKPIQHHQQDRVVDIVGSEAIGRQGDAVALVATQRRGLGCRDPGLTFV
jgi:hypothetical protein